MSQRIPDASLEYAFRHLKTLLHLHADDSSAQQVQALLSVGEFCGVPEEQQNEFFDLCIEELRWGDGDVQPSAAWVGFLLGVLAIQDADSVAKGPPDGS